MDFALTADQEALRDLARQILSDRCTAEHLTAIAATESGTDRALWRTCADAGLVAINLPEAAGGGGYGWLEAAIVLSEIGRVVAPLPGLAVIAMAAPALAAVHAEHPQLLDGVATGEQVVTAGALFDRYRIDPGARLGWLSGFGRAAYRQFDE